MGGGGGMGQDENRVAAVTPPEALPDPSTEDGRTVELAKGIPIGKSVFDIEPEDENLSPIEEVNLTVPITDDPSIPVWTFRMWLLGIFFCVLLSFLNQFFDYRTESLVITGVTAQISAMPMGKFMAATFPKRVLFKGTRFACSLNPGPFNIKEHVLITIFANAGAGGVYATAIVTIVKTFYRRTLSFVPALLLCVTTQLLGYGWAGLFRDFLIKPGVMWWPWTLVQVSLFRTLHEKDVRKKGQYTRQQFFSLAVIVSFAAYLLPGYFIPMMSSLSWVCWAWPNSTLAHQLGSGIRGLGIGAIGLDWSVITSFLLSPLASPWFATANIAVGYVLIMYVLTPIVYWGNFFDAKKFPIFSSRLFRSTGEEYDVTKIVGPDFRLDMAAYDKYGKVHLSGFFAMTYGVGFASLTAVVSHVALFYGKDIWRLVTRAMKNNKEDVHTRLMRTYPEAPQWWFYAILVSMTAISIASVEVFKDQLQLPWWGVLFAISIAFVFTLPIGIITATTNQVLGLNVITEYIMGYVYPGRPVANVCFKTYGYISSWQAITFLQDIKLGHYMKIPPKSMFMAQTVGTVIATVVSLGTAWWMLATVEHICNVDGLLPPGSPWTCPGSRVFFDASVIWGLVGPKRIFGSLGLYKQVNWWFLVGFFAPFPVWVSTKIWPNVKFLRYINMPLLIGATAILPPATAVNFTMWILFGFIFNHLVFKYRKNWWARYNYVLSAGLDAGLAFCAVLLYFVVGLENVSITWWGSNLDNCPRASCPTFKGLGQPNPNCPAT